MRISIRAKVVLFAVFMIIFAAVLSSNITVFYQIKTMKDSLRMRSLSLARNLAYNADYGVLIKDKRILEDLTEGVSKEPDVLFVMIQDKEGEILAYSGKKETKKRPFQDYKSDMRHIFENKNFHEVRSPIFLIQPQMGTEADLEESIIEKEPEEKEAKRELIGTAIVAMSFESTYHSMRQVLVFIFFLTLIVVFGVSILSVFLVNRLVGNIVKLSKATQKITEGDLTYKVQVKSNDEIGTLSESFNVMVEELKRSTVSREYVDSIIANMMNMLIVTDNEWQIRRVNKEACSLLEYDGRELVDQSIDNLFVFDSGKHFSTEIGPMVREGGIRDFVGSCIAKSGEKIPVSLSCSEVINKKDEKQGIVIVFMDLTARKKAEEALRLGQLGKLVADMAHEVNNPLMIISGRAQISMLKGMGSKDFKGNCKIIMDQCQRARDIIQRLLLFSKPGKGEIKEVDIKDVIDFVIQLVEHQFLLININIVKRYARSLPSLKIDEKQFHEVLMNVLKNSAEAMPEGGIITVVTAREGNNIRIDITDTGQGIETKNLMRIFDPFFTTKESGTGLGLSVCYGIIKVYGGDMKCTSRPGEGTTMAVFLPITQQ